MRNVGETIFKWMGKGQLAQACVPVCPVGGGVILGCS